MLPPTLVGYTSGGFTGTGQPKTASVTVAVGDVLTIVATAETNTTTVATPTGGTSIAWTLKQSLTGTNLAPVYIWTAPVTTAQTFTISVSRAGGSGEFGFGVFQHRNHGGPGASNSASGTTGTPSVSLTTTNPNSAIIAVNADWETVDGSSSRVWVSVNSSAPTDETYAAGSSAYYVAIYADAGAAGAKTPGLSAPAGQHWQMAAIEIIGISSGGTLQLSSGFFGAPS